MCQFLSKKVAGWIVSFYRVNGLARSVAAFSGASRVGSDVDARRHGAAEFAFVVARLEFNAKRAEADAHAL
jgi:hypothetical protein